ncbi:MAG: 16S rRNA (guanine(527)-N(7))-methyltransferase RsmG [Lautropia sp.]
MPAPSQAPPPLRSYRATTPALPAVAAALQLALPGDTLQRLQDYVHLLLRWNRTYNLVGARDEATIVAEHVADCLAIVPVLQRRLDPARTRLVDMGSGGGLPAVIIAMSMPALHVVAVEPVAKKAAFLRQAAAVCHIPNISVAETRMAELLPHLSSIEATQAPARERHFSSRAFADMRTLIAEATPFATRGSRLFAMKSARLQHELATVDASRVQVHDLTVPTLDAPRYLAEVRLEAPPDRMPSADTPRPTSATERSA